MRVEFNLEVLPEDTPIRGNAMYSDDDDYNRKVEDSIIAELEGGNIWAWCTVRVTARIGSFEGADYLGCGSYKDEADFLASDYYTNMKGIALNELRAKCADAHAATLDLSNWE